MTTLRHLLLLVLLCAALPLRAAEAPDGQELSLKLQLDYASKYMWRGIAYNADPVVKPSLVLGYSGLELNISGIIDSNNYWGREDNFEEVDYDLSYHQAVNDQLTLKGGVIYFFYPGQSSPADVAVYLRGTYDSFLQPELTAYYDCRNAEGWYLSLKVSHEIPLPAVHENLALILDNTLGWASSNWNNYTTPLRTDENTFVNLSPGATLQYTASEHLSFAWYARYDYLLDSTARDHADLLGYKSSNFSFGANVAYKF
jgi:uncharacterized protein (TIGR02001 family)